MTDNAAHTVVVAGRYRLERRLARGGMATVHLAHDEVLDRPVALKIMLTRLAQDPTFVARFQREAQSAAKLNNPNIVAVYDWGAHEDTYFIAMEYVEGETLDALLKAHGPLGAEDATRIAIDVAQALSCAHRQQTVHRDIKPANILIAPDGSAKVTDFGIARAVEGDADLTEVGKVLGTALYFSPEQAQGHRVGPSSDLYALGVVLFEMLTGKPVFDGASAIDVAMKHIEQAPPRPSSKVSSIPSHLDAIVVRLLAKDPDDRYLSAAALLDDLDRDGSFEPTDEEAEADAVASVEAGDMPTSLLDHDASTPTATMALSAESEEHLLRRDEADAASSAEPPNGRSGYFMAAAVILGIAALALSVLVAQALIAESDSAAPGLLIVPAVVGESEAAATNILIDAGFTPMVRFDPNGGAETGLVVEQIPAGQTQAEEGSPVTIVVSGAEPISDEVAETPAVTEDAGTTEPAAPELAEVPDVGGADQASAEQRLIDLGFAVAINLVDVDPAVDPVGFVRAQNPAANTQAAKGATITLEVGNAPVAEPTSSTTAVASSETTAASAPATPTTAGSTTPTPSLSSPEARGASAPTEPSP